MLLVRWCTASSTCLSAVYLGWHSRCFFAIITIRRSLLVSAILCLKVLWSSLNVYSLFSTGSYLIEFHSFQHRQVLILVKSCIQLFLKLKHRILFIVLSLIRVSHLWLYLFWKHIELYHLSFEWLLIRFLMAFLVRRSLRWSISLGAGWRERPKLRYCSSLTDRF